MHHRLAPAAALAAALAFPLAAYAQQRLPSMPNYAQYTARRDAGGRVVVAGAVAVTWAADGQGLGFDRDGKHYRFDFTSGQTVPVDAPVEGQRAPVRRRRGGAGMPARGRQFDQAASPDGAVTAVYHDRNLYLKTPDGRQSAVTTDGSDQARVKYGTADWVYGEELDQRTAMWWSPDSRYLAYYRFDESKVHDFYLTTNMEHIQDVLYTEPYPKAGAPNPVVDVYVYDRHTAKSVRVDVRSGQPLTDATMGYYVYDLAWSPDGTELLFHRTNRAQNALEKCAANPATGAVRVFLRQEWRSGWTDIHPETRWLPDGRRFIVSSTASGYRNYEMHDLKGGAPVVLTHNRFDADSIAGLDAKNGVLYYVARDGDDYMKPQLHRVNLDGSADRRLTNTAFCNTVSMSPDLRYFTTVEETADTPPVTDLYATDGRHVARIGESDIRAELPGPKPEIFTYMAADGATTLYGILYKPSNFDASKRYPMLVTVYAGPETESVNQRYRNAPAYTDLGYLVASFNSRGGSGRGKAFEDAMYLHMGVTEIDDIAAGVRALDARPYVDAARVGVFGTSYGGYASVMCLLRYPGVFAAASCSSSPTDWRNYDSIYTERYMGMPTANQAGYDAGAAMPYAKDLKGRLLLYYGTADDNVHPNNTIQLIQALQDAGKSFDVQIGPDEGHSGVNFERMLEFFGDALHPAQP